MSRILALATALSVTIGSGSALLLASPRHSARPAHAAPPAARPLDDEGPFTGFDGGTAWINSSPLTASGLRGHVVVVDFWAFSCSNCLAALPHIKALEAKFRDRGVVVVGVHTPELAHERVESNVRDAVHGLGIVYPVVIDGKNRIWNAFNNEYWPAVYIVDAQGRVRYHHFGEGSYDEQEQVVGELLADAAR
jgi:thiol-disulfide isomerase/thioredoxin